jgi:glycosyltransferase involved in cell wall biosynthesis
MPNLRLLALATNPTDAASTRFRLAQWAPTLAAAGFRLTIEPFYPETATPLIQGPGRPLAKIAGFVRWMLRRRHVLARAAREADVLLVHREAFPFGWPIALRAIRAFPGAVVYDYDDAMFLPQRAGRFFAHLERLDTPAQVMTRSDLVLAGNAWLADYARRHTPHVVELPTCVDPSRFAPIERPERPDGPRVGWIGSRPTSKYLAALVPALNALAADHPFTFRVVGSPSRLEDLTAPATYAPWALDREIAEFQACDIGVYPMWNDDFALGKCGFKAIQFMACGVPVVAAAVGANRDIVQDGVNGFLASTDAEWAEKLGWLLSDAALREKLGQAGRRTVLEKYSIEANGPRLVEALRAAVARRGGKA